MAQSQDLDALYDLAGLTGGGMTNLPQDRDALAEKISRSMGSIAAAPDRAREDFYLLVLEHTETRTVIGTASLFACLGLRWPFYSYKIGRVTHASRDLDRSIASDTLHLVNDFDGATEVGGLFVHPSYRTDGMGRLLARSRYMFIAQHRERFAERTVAELRGYAVDGISPFWEAVGRPFFGSDFLDADRHNALHGNQFIADLMPRYPIYASLLPTAAREAIGRPHPGSVPALRLLAQDGFRQEGYIDIFDGGPTLSIATDEIRAIRDSVVSASMRDCALPDASGRHLIASGHGDDFLAWCGLGSTSRGYFVFRDVDTGFAERAASGPIRHVLF